MSIFALNPVMARLRARKALLPVAPDPKPADDVSRVLADRAARVRAGDHPAHAEIQRIVAMPLVFPMDEAELEEYNRTHLLAAAFQSGFRLFPVQAEGLCAYEMYGGGFLPIPVGFGKTLLSLMIANAAWNKGLKKMVLFVPSQVFGQLTVTDIKWARTRVPIGYPIHLMGGRSIKARRSLARSQKVGLYIFPYSMLSTKDTSDNLDEIAPQLMICDEAHNLANRTAARTKRFLSVVEAMRPEIVALSGTITDKSVMDYYHIIRVALRQNNPLPNSLSMAHEWSVILDAKATSDGDIASASTTGPLVPLISWAKHRFPGIEFGEDTPSFRRAYKLRLNTAPGVVAPGDSLIGTSLILANEKVQGEGVEGWEELSVLIKNVEEMWVTPNGDEIEHAIHTWKWLNELSAGFYNELSWPPHDIYASRKNISPDHAAETLNRSKTHHAAGQVYASALRKWLDEKSRPGLDTPMLVGLDMSKHGKQNVGEDLYALWADWKGLDFLDRPERDSHAIQVCPYKINAAVEWVKALPKHRGALIWVYHQEVGRWLVNEMTKQGLDPLHCPAGDVSNIAILEPENTNRKIVASITAHGTGKNLQHFEEQYFVQWPRQARTAEQALGRTHRNGQKADELVVRTNVSSAFDELNFAACLNDALYIHQTTGNRQKLIYANYDPLPKIFPPAVLQERGLQNKMLNAEQQAIMEARFGQG